MASLTKSYTTIFKQFKRRKMSVNKVMLLGNVGSVDFKSFDNGGKIVNISVATSESYKKGEEWINKTEWHRCSCGIPAIVERAERINKGDMVHVEGSIVTRTWEKDGEKRESKEISFDKIKVISKSTKTDESESFVPKTKSEPKTGKQVLDSMEDDGGLPF
jgi:single stranded DNA-binding protein